jgi:hypothetical protein
VDPGFIGYLFLHYDFFRKHPKDFGTADIDEAEDGQSHKCQ